MTTMARGLGRGITRRVNAAAMPRVGLAHLLVLLLLAVAVSAVGVGALYQRAHHAAAVEQARTAAVEAARSHATEILAYDHRTLDHDIAQAKATTTGDLRKDYSQLTADLVGPKAKKNKVVVRADVLGSAVVEASPDEVVVLLFVNQVTQSKLLDGPRVDQNRVRMTLTEVDGKWLASDLAAL